MKYYKIVVSISSVVVYSVEREGTEDDKYPSYVEIYNQIIPEKEKGSLTIKIRRNM